MVDYPETCFKIWRCLLIIPLNPHLGGLSLFFCLQTDDILAQVIVISASLEKIISLREDISEIYVAIVSKEPIPSFISPCSDHSLR